MTAKKKKDAAAEKPPEKSRAELRAELRAQQAEISTRLDALDALDAEDARLARAREAERVYGLIDGLLPLAVHEDPGLCREDHPYDNYDDCPRCALLYAKEMRQPIDSLTDLRLVLGT